MWKQEAEADIAQMAEHLFCTQSVAGSRPAIGSKRLYHAVQYAHGRGTVVCPSCTKHGGEFPRGWCLHRRCV